MIQNCHVPHDVFRKCSKIHRLSGLPFIKDFSRLVASKQSHSEDFLRKHKFWIQVYQVLSKSFLWRWVSNLISLNLKKNFLYVWGCGFNDWDINVQHCTQHEGNTQMRKALINTDIILIWKYRTPAPGVTE